MYSLLALVAGLLGRRSKSIKLPTLPPLVKPTVIKMKRRTSQKHHHKAPFKPFKRRAA